MNKRYIHISECESGQILAKDVVNSIGAKIVAKETVINEYIKNKLLELGENYVWVLVPQIETGNKTDSMHYEEVRGNYIDNVLTVKEILLDFASGSAINYSRLVDLSDVIYSEINSTGVIIKCLNELKSTDEYTYNHSINVSVYAMLLAKWIGLSRNDIKKVIQAGILHDIGKLRIPDEILNKKDRLSFEEFEKIKRHAAYGYEILKKDDLIEADIQEAVLFHHERIDGSGYPLGITGSALNLYSKIIAIADVYDAMTSERVYKRRSTPFDAFEMFMTEGMGTFDPTLLRTFLNNLPIYYVGANITLSNGQIGEIVYVPPQDIIHPIIRLESDYIELSKLGDIRIMNFL